MDSKPVVHDSITSQKSVLERACKYKSEIVPHGPIKKYGIIKILQPVTQRSGDPAWRPGNRAPEDGTTLLIKAPPILAKCSAYDTRQAMPRSVPIGISQTYISITVKTYNNNHNVVRCTRKN